jgi:hypothetical protein
VVSSVADQPTASIKKLDISALKPLSDGNYGIFINKNLFGQIDAHPKAEFVLSASRSPIVLKAGKHTVDFPPSSKLSVEVKDLPSDLTFREVGRFGKKEEDIERDKRKNKETMDLILSRVVVAEI